MKDQNIVISTRTIFILLLIGLLFWMAWIIKPVLLALFVSLILALALEPAVLWLNSRKVPHGVSVLTVVLAVFILVVSLATVAIVPFVHQAQNLIIGFPKYLDNLSSAPGYEEYAVKFYDALINQISQTSGNIIGATIGAFSGALSTVIVLVFTVYILLDFENIRKKFIGFLPEANRDEIQNLVTRIEKKLGGWLRGQIILMLIIGVATYIGLAMLGLDFSLALAVTAGLFEIVPIIGPILSLIPAVIIGFVVSPVMGFAVIGLYLLIQQMENHLIVPKVMQRAVGLNPLVTIVALMVGGKLLGLVGAVLAIPLAIIVLEVVKFAIKSSRR
ncbi:hypothetical protein A2982_01370 [candidate division WWE3 bacterium RIFCSPLOWO2_01_FULL_39_13]|uniref:AI-2E family transporter n=1 Tax=candidate division WWE3 bacterium RIFCSPLOWO2_01_FULL_39_13 TaxID=1802624 RepID=A0A1F4V4J9_UNCKA|nr:MAG: hypothetical protein A2982_01370 [candidate division WWE3 bacterium RIFCSPLOWO2_01_FULL_39_13]